MSDENQLLLSGMKEVAKSIPDSAWDKLVNTACVTFEQCVAPITKTAEGLGRLIEAKFNCLVDAEKILAAQTMQKANEKVRKANRPLKGIPKPRVIADSIECSALQTDETIQELWANLIAQEIIEGTVHPEFTKILNRLTGTDAQVLAKVAEEGGKPILMRAAHYLLTNLSIAGVTLGYLIPDDSDFTHAHLENLKLIKPGTAGWVLSPIGEAFIKAVSDPSVMEHIAMPNNGVE